MVHIADLTDNIQHHSNISTAPICAVEIEITQVDEHRFDPYGTQTWLSKSSNMTSTIYLLCAELFHLVLDSVNCQDYFHRSTTCISVP